MLFQQFRSQFLQTSFGIKPVEFTHGVVDCTRHQLRYDTVRHNCTRIQIHSTNHGFECVRQNRRLFAATSSIFTFAQQQMIAQAKIGSNCTERICVHNTLTQVGQFAFLKFRMALVHNVGNYPTEHGVAQKLEALVGLEPIVFRCPRTMSHCGCQQCLIGKAMPNSLGQRLEQVAHFGCNASAISPTMLLSTIS